MKPAIAVLCLLALAGCQSNSEGQTGETMSRNDLAGSKPKVTQGELEAFCPPVRVRQGTAALNRYARGGDGDPSKLAFQASIGESTRACTRADGNLTIDVAAAGRVVPGPAAPASVTLPIRVVVTRGDDVLYSELHRQEVTLTDRSAATQYLFRNSNVVIPIPSERNVMVQLGFDDGAK
ncbi:MAG: hypothetical protein M9924_02220 [Rhizobiaceae bacterium]|nr:hypothetical protein [Rhizobiaceae bacterium]